MLSNVYVVVNFSSGWDWLARLKEIGLEIFPSFWKLSSLKPSVVVMYKRSLYLVVCVSHMFLLYSLLLDPQLGKRFNENLWKIKIFGLNGG